MEPRRAALSFLAVALGATACRPREEARPDVVVPTPSAAAAVRTPPPALTYRLVHTFPAEVALFGAGAAVIACEGWCFVPPAGKPAPRTWVVEGDRVHEEASLWPASGPREATSVSFAGRYPDRLFAILDSWGDRTGGREVVRRSGTTWARAEAGDSPPSEAIPPPPRALLEARVRAPLEARSSQMVHGGGGPLLIIGPRKLARWTGDAWTTSDAPWAGPVQYPARLASGATLVASREGAFRVAPDGSIAPLPLDVPQGPPDAGDRGYVLVRGAVGVWIGATQGGRTLLFASTAPEAAAPAAYTLEEEPARARAVAAVPQAEPFSPACRTPFVITERPERTSPKDRFGYHRLVDALREHVELEGAVRFVEINRGSYYDVGAQARTVQEARLLMAIVEAGAPAGKPELVCLDVASALPDPTSPPSGIRVLWINLGTGELVE